MPSGSTCAQHPSCSLWERTWETPLLLTLSVLLFRTSILGPSENIWAWARPHQGRPPQNLFQSFAHPCWPSLHFSSSAACFWGGDKQSCDEQWADLLRGQPATTARSQLWVITFGAHEFLCHIRLVYKHRSPFIYNQYHLLIYYPGTCLARTFWSSSASPSQFSRALANFLFRLFCRVVYEYIEKNRFRHIWHPPSLTPALCFLACLFMQALPPW